MLMLSEQLLHSFLKELLEVQSIMRLYSPHSYFHKNKSDLLQLVLTRDDWNNDCDTMQKFRAYKKTKESQSAMLQIQ